MALRSVLAALFVSYARRDGAALALRLVDDLARAGHAAWLDKAEIQGGDDWSRTIEQAIDGCEAMVAVLTAGSYESRVCRGEQLRALRKGKRIVPVLAQADAERPVYLEPEHYIDFSAALAPAADAALYAARLAELTGTLAQGGGVGWAQLSARVRQRLQDDETLGAQMPRTLAGATDWAALVARATAQLGRFRDALAGRSGAPGVYEPGLYVERAAEQAALQRLAQSPATALVLLGDPGIGKTNLLCRWADLCTADGDAVFAWAGERLDAAQLEGEIARDLGFEDGAALAAAWPRMDTLARGAGRRLWLLIDGLNDARGEQDAVRTLLLACDRLVARLPEGAVKVVLSCTQATWQRLDRQEALRLAWRRYLRGADDAELLVIDRFTPAQAEDAWARCAQRFALPVAIADLPPDFRVRLREPVLLRLLAEALAGRPVPADMADFDTLLFQQYHTRHVRRREDQAFVDDLAAEMLAQRSAALPVQPLLRHPTLGPALADEAPGSPAIRLLDDGVLVEVRGNLFDDDRLRFAYPQIGAYALVRQVLRTPARPLAQAVRELAAAADTLPLAWEAALVLLSMRGDAATLGALADDADPELRELALESLVRAHGSQPAPTRALLAGWLDGGTPTQQRTALRAAFHIGPAVRDLLVHAALSASAELRTAVRDTLYVLWHCVSQSACETRSHALYFVWRHAPDFTRALMLELVDRLRWLHPKEAAHILAFVLDLTITIYVNHCERPEIVEQTAAIFHRLTVERLHLDKIVLGAAFERVVFRVVASVFAERLLRWMLLEGDADPAVFFRSAGPQRAALAQAAAWLDPAVPPDAATLQAMFESSVPVLRGAAALVVAVQAGADAPSAAPLVQQLADTLDARGRAWLMAGFSVLWPGTPATWLPLLESLTRRSMADAPPLLPFFDGLFVPLGLACAKAGAPMALFDELLAAAPAQPAVAARLLDALGIVGFYRPQSVLALLRPRLPALLADAALAPAVVAALATIRTLHFDLVDGLLLQAGASDAVQRDVIAGADPARVQQFMRLLGYYNNAVHYCIHYPRMRRGLGASALQLLASAPSAAGFIAGYAAQAIAMAREAGFDLRQWTLPAAADVPAGSAPSTYSGPADAGP